MKENKNDQSTPDVEAIIAKIRKSSNGNEALSNNTEDNINSEEMLEGVREESNLYKNLETANLTCNIPKKSFKGIKGIIRTGLYIILSPLINHLNRFHGSVIHVINKLVKIIDGQDTTISSELLMKTQRRIDLLTQFSNRLSDYDDMNIDQRLRKLEAEISELNKRINK